MSVTVEVTVDGRGGYDRYLPPRLNGFRPLGGGMSTQNIEVINWNVRRRESYRYQALALKEGRYSLGPAAVVVGGRVVKSRVVSVVVRKGASGRSAPGADDDPNAADPGDGGTAPSAAPLTSAVPPGLQLPPGPLPPVFIAATVLPRKVFVGQQIVATWKLYTQSDVLGFRSSKQPITDGFWADDLQSPNRLVFEDEQIAGRRFYGAVLARKALFPQRTGKLTIGETVAQVRTMSLFGRALEQRSEPVEIEVAPLPEAGKPAGFSEQNVGSYMLATTLDRQRVKAGEAVRFKVVARGEGNLRQLTMPKLESTSAYKVYEPKLKTTLEPVLKVAGERVAEYLVLPQRGGRIALPALSLSFFDPAAQRYRSSVAKALVLEVEGTLAGQGPAAKGGTNIIGADQIRPPRPPVELSSRGALAPLAPLYFILWLAPLVGLLTLTGVRRLRLHLRQETARSLGRAAAKRIKERLKRARAARAEGKGDVFGELSAALREQLASQLGSRVEGLTRDELRAELLAAGFESSLTAEVIAELDSCDFARFAAGAAYGGEQADAYRRVENLLKRLARAPLVRVPLAAAGKKGRRSDG